MKLIDYFRQDIATSNTHMKRDQRRYWTRAICATLKGRGFEIMEPRPQRKPDKTLPFTPFWSKVPDAELFEVLKKMNLKDFEDDDED